MYKIALLLIAGILFVGCSTSSLNLNKKELVLNYNSNNFLLSNSIIEDKLLNYKELFVKQYKLEDQSGRILFYEEAKTTLNFEFNFGDLYTVMYIFDDAQAYEEVYRKNNLRLIQLELKNSMYINVLIQASDTQIISYVYGFSNDEFLSLARELLNDSKEKIKPLENLGLVLNKSQEPLTKWNDTMVYFTPLITPFNQMMAIR